MSVKIIDTLKPKNNGAFPIVEAVDVAVTDELRLPEALASKADASDLAETNAAVEGKASTSDLTTATANLQGQINQIEISATAEAVVAPEVAAARVGTDGTEYTTLKEHLDATDSYNENADNQLSSNIATICSTLGIGFLAKSNTRTIPSGTTKHFLNLGDLKAGKKYDFVCSINHTSSNAVYFFVYDGSTAIASKNIASGSTTYSFSLRPESDVKDAYVNVRTYEELTVTVSASSSEFDDDTVHINSDAIADLDADKISSEKDISNIMSIIGSKFIPKSISKTVNGSKQHVLDVGDIYSGATYTFTFSIESATTDPVYFTIKNDSETIATRNIASGQTTHTYNFNADSDYQNVYINATSSAEVTVTINVTATGYGTDNITKNQQDITALQMDITRIDNALGDITVDVSDYEDVTSDATIHDDEFVSWYSLTPTEAINWQYLTIAVTAGQTYRVTSYGGSNARNWILAVDGVIVDYCSEENQATRTVDVPISQSGVLYVNNNITKVTASIKLKIPKSGIDGEQVYIDKEPIDERMAKSNPLYKKIICCCGDSITYGDDMDQEGFTDDPDIDVYQWNNGQWNKQTSGVRMPWGYQIASRNNMTFYNGGVNGSTMQGIQARNGFSLENGRYTKKT